MGSFHYRSQVGLYYLSHTKLQNELGPDRNKLSDSIPKVTFLSKPLYHQSSHQLMHKCFREGCYPGTGRKVLDILKTCRFLSMCPMEGATQALTGSFCSRAERVGPPHQQHHSGLRQKGMWRMAELLRGTKMPVNLVPILPYRSPGKPLRAHATCCQRVM